MTNYYKKYLKYKNKYLSLLEQKGGKDNHYNLEIECVYVKSAVNKLMEEQEACLMPSVKLRFVDQDVSWVDIIDKLNESSVLKNKIDSRQVRKIMAKTSDDDKMKIDDPNETLLLTKHNNFKKVQIYLNPVDNTSKEFFELDDERKVRQQIDEISY